jgi:hypothetical protein
VFALRKPAVRVTSSQAPHLALRHTVQRSTTRALYAAYTGNLYQVTRQSDSTTTNIAVLTDGSGYAAAATQDAFCANTTCTITRIYDQSSEHNDLTLAPPGGEASGPGPGGYDVAVSATALPIIAGGIKCTVSLSHPESVTATMQRPVSR